MEDQKRNGRQREENVNGWNGVKQKKGKMKGGEC
jgi:hypothetical protein